MVRPIWISMKQEMMGWQWHQTAIYKSFALCTSLQRDNHASTSSLNPKVSKNWSHKIQQDSKNDCKIYYFKKNFRGCNLWTVIINDNQKNQVKNYQRGPVLQTKWLTVVFFSSFASRHDVCVLNPVTLTIVTQTVLHFKVITVHKSTHFCIWYMKKSMYWYHVM